MKKLFLFILLVTGVFFQSSVVHAQSCAGGNAGFVRYSNGVESCTDKYGNACVRGTSGCTCSFSCGVGAAWIAERCADYTNNCAACASVNNDKNYWNCTSGSCSWNGVADASCSMCYTGWQNLSCGGGSCASTSMQQRNVAAGTAGLCSTLYRCSANHPACVPPTPTDPKPTPTPVPLTAPANLQAVCDATGTRVSLSWDVVTGATSYPLRFNNAPNVPPATNCDAANNSWWSALAGECDLDNLATNTYANLPVVSGRTYGWWVHGYNATSGYGPATYSSFTCTASPTPTPTGAPVTPFFKVKNTSFYKYGNLDLIYPATLTAFDADDTTSNASNQGGYGGVVLSQGTTSLTNATISTSGWNRQNVSAGTFNASSFVAYVKSKKTYTAINTNLNGVTAANTTYLYTGNLTLTQSSFPTSTIPAGTVLLVEGNVTVGAAGQTTLNTTANTPFALIVTGTLTFADATTQANGLYAASAVNFGTGAVPLKIVGNVVSGSSSAISRQRTSAPLNAPSLFVVFDPTHYVNLIDRISVVKSDYQQVQ